MIIEETTTYAYKIKRAVNLTFDNVRAIAKKFIDDLPQDDVNELYDELNHGIDQLTTEPQMLTYLYSFGNMHQFKLNRAFEQLPDAFLQQPEIRIVDYGCGQAIGTMCYADYLAEQGLSQNIISVTLIEPSEICLKRAVLHVSQFFPDAEIHTFCKTFNDLTDDDIANSDDIPTLHILSNVLDIQAFDLEDFANLIANDLSNYNQFVCVGPYFNYSDKDERMRKFAELLDGNVSYSQIFEKGELSEGKTWTAQIVCFSVGELEEEELSTEVTEVTEEEIRNGIEDEFGVIYSKDWKRLLKCKNDKIENYVIKEGTKVICDYSFLNCKSLQHIDIPDSILCIGYISFGYCISLKQIIIPNTIINIGRAPFVGCERLGIKSLSSRFICQDNMLVDKQKKLLISYSRNYYSELTIPDIIESIGDEAFSSKSLKQIYISNTVTRIGSYAFEMCKFLEQITIPDSVTTIANNAFDGTESLQHIFVPVDCIDYFKKILQKNVWDKIYVSTKVTKEEIENSIEDEFGVVYSKDGKRLLKNNNRYLESYEIKRGAKVICDEAFAYNYNLKHIICPNSIITIGKCAFINCHSLQEINIPDYVTSIYDSAFRGCKKLSQITIPISITYIGYNIFVECDIHLKSNSSRFIVQNNLLIDNYRHRVVLYAGNDETIEIPDSITDIGNNSFFLCESLKRIVISDSVLSIGDCAFLSCKSLQQINIPNSVTNIGKNAFHMCKSLEQIHIPNSIKEISNYTFQFCSSIQQITIPNSVQKIGSGAFYGCESLKQISIPNSVTSIGDLAFNDCKSLEHINIPNSITYLGGHTFFDCSHLQQINFPNTITRFGPQDFAYCESLKQINIPDSVIDMNHWTFQGCKSLQQIILPNSISFIGFEMFDGCESLQQITIPDSVTKIYKSAFSNCKSLRQITISDSVEEFGVPFWNNEMDKDTFNGCDLLEQILIPEGTTEKFKKMLPKELWDKLYCLKKAE